MRLYFLLINLLYLVNCFEYIPKDMNKTYFISYKNGTRHDEILEDVNKKYYKKYKTNYYKNYQKKYLK